ncbi:PREDICTED: protein transport protein Sec24C-like, partial [Pterocles gutturalis]|uniref:protein transport protein Sec24C-like n=1 Tax=Pterocles gutturalis TaxID=240206 RepID=UPI000529583D
MSVNQQAHAGPPYGQPQPGYQGYQQPAYGGQPLPGVPQSQYGAYNGPMPGYQQPVPPQGYFPSLGFPSKGSPVSLNSDSSSLAPNFI